MRSRDIQESDIALTFENTNPASAAPVGDLDKYGAQFVLLQAVEHRQSDAAPGSEAGPAESVASSEAC